jgi:predicted acylesterase/phospholipase RssA
MNKIGLALSGGGFRASLYHLGLLRFLRDAGILPRVTHITSVSGGSIVAAHVTLNWQRYNGSPTEFDAAAAEFLSFVGLDVRNRIFRRFPLAVTINWPRKLLGGSSRMLTRTGLLEYHYQKHLYGDVSLFELPATPQLHLLATNLNEGCLSSFSRDGLLLARPQAGAAGHSLYIHRVHVGLATVAMAVTASSAYPGFFPPMELTGADVGACGGDFGRQAFTDGGVFDNLGVRMFRCLERPLMADSPLCADGFFDVHEALQLLREAGHSAEQTPLHRLWQLVTAAGGGGSGGTSGNGGGGRQQPLLLSAGAGGGGGQMLQGATAAMAVLEGGNGESEHLILARLWEVMRRYQFYHDPLFARLRPADPDADAYLRASRSGGAGAGGGRILDIADRLWLNRHLLEAAFRDATGRGCFRRLNSGLDGVLVSDVGKPIEVQGNRRSGGVIRTALRASDILMDRVWQLEKETFHDAPGFVFAPITDIVDPAADDPMALHPEIQRQTANIRTDMDRFSPLEISSLIRHGYCVGRKACRARPDLFGTDLPTDAPWDPIPAERGAAPGTGKVTRGHGSSPPKAPAPATVEARTLQTSALRRIWTTLLDFRDWTSYVYVPILVPIIVLLPYAGAKWYRHSHRVNQLVQSLSQGSRDLDQMTRLLESRSVPWKGAGFDEIDKPFPPDPKGFQIIQDSRILDLRDWNARAADAGSLSFGYRRLKVAKTPEHTGDNHFYLYLLPRNPRQTAARFPPQELQPKLLRANADDGAGDGAGGRGGGGGGGSGRGGGGGSPAPGGEKECVWQVAYDLGQVPVGDPVDLIVEYYSPGSYIRRGDSGSTLPLDIRTPTAELTLWIMLPMGREYRTWRVVRYPKDKPQAVEAAKVVTEYMSDDSSILAFKLLSLKPDYTYEVQWFYK